jgi:sodium/hydrogen exchanger 10/11
MTGSFFKFDILESIDPHAVMFIFLPPLIFESAFYADGHIFIKSFKTIVSMAGIGVIIASVVTMLLIMIIFPAYTLNENIDYSIYGFTPTILPAMLLGVTLSATDPVAVVSLLNSLGAPKELGTMIEGESLLNDGTAYGFFSFNSKIDEELLR